MKRMIILMGVLLFSVNAMALSSDTGKITNFFVNDAGEVAFYLDSGFPNGKAKECPQTNGFAGTKAGVDPIFKSALLSAKSMNKKVVIVTLGCHPNNAWINVVNVYILD